MPANRAISLHPDFEYQLVQVEGECLILAADLVESVMKRAGITSWVVLGSCKGADLELQRFQHPFMGFDVPIVLGEHVTLEAGTGAVHTAQATVLTTMLSVRNMVWKRLTLLARTAAT